MNVQKSIIKTDGTHPKGIHNLLWLGLFTIARVEGNSMIPTLYPDDLVLAIKIRGQVQEGDVVLADVGGYSVIKRVQSFDDKTSSCMLGGEQPFAKVPLSWIHARVIMLFSWHTGFMFL